jgi:hypothetical protein
MGNEFLPFSTHDATGTLDWSEHPHECLERAQKGREAVSVPSVSTIA